MKTNSKLTCVQTFNNCSCINKITFTYFASNVLVEIINGYFFGSLHDPLNKLNVPYIMSFERLISHLHYAHIGQTLDLKKLYPVKTLATTTDKLKYLMNLDLPDCYLQKTICFYFNKYLLFISKNYYLTDQPCVDLTDYIKNGVIAF